MLEIILICWKLMIESYYRKIWRFRAIGKTLSPEDQLIVKESKAHKEKSTETRNENTDKKCVLANQLVDKYGRDASKFLDLSVVVFKSQLGNRKSEFECVPSRETVDRLW